MIKEENYVEYEMRKINQIKKTFWRRLISWCIIWYFLGFTALYIIFSIMHTLKQRWLDLLYLPLFIVIFVMVYLLSNRYWRDVSFCWAQKNCPLASAYSKQQLPYTHQNDCYSHQCNINIGNKKYQYDIGIIVVTSIILGAISPNYSYWYINNYLKVVLILSYATSLLYSFTNYLVKYDKGIIGINAVVETITLWLIFTFITYSFLIGMLHNFVTGCHTMLQLTLYLLGITLGITIAIITIYCIVKIMKYVVAALQKLANFINRDM